MTESERLLLMDMKDFNRLGLGTDDLIDAVTNITSWVSCLGLPRCVSVCANDAGDDRH
jgi:hypothetical protein